MGTPVHAKVARALLATALGALLPLALATAQPDKQPEKLPPPKPLPTPKAMILLKDRHGHATPERYATAHTGAGNTDVSQPSDDKVIVTMTGVAVAGPHPCKVSTAAMDFDFNQCFQIVLNDEKLKTAKLTLEAYAIGLLRGDQHGGNAAMTRAAATVAAGLAPVVWLEFEPHSVSGCENLAINDHKGPITVPAPVGEYQLLLQFRIDTAHACSICGKAAAAEFAPDPALDPTWISVTEPFHGAQKKDFGLRVIVRVEPE
jgi:hypothetical protein